MSLTRRQLLVRSGAPAGALASAPAFGATNLRKLIDIGPGGVIHPGSAQDHRAGSKRAYFADTQTDWITEGGARPAKMKTLYPTEDPLAARAKCLQTAWNLHASGGGEGVAMLAQYLLSADPDYDCGLLEPAPSTVKRPAYATWKTFPERS